MDIAAGWGVDADQVKIRVEVADHFYDSDAPEVTWVDDGDGDLWLSFYADYTQRPVVPDGGTPEGAGAPPHLQGTDKLSPDGNPA